MAVGLVCVLIAVLLGPVLIEPIGENIEVFFLAAGAFASAITRQWNLELLSTTLTQPIALTIAVLVFGVVARIMRPSLDAWFKRLATSIAPQWIYFSLIVVLGLLSSVITAVIAALILVEAIALLKLDRASETGAVVLACFAIGLGAALTRSANRSARSRLQLSAPISGTWCDCSDRSSLQELSSSESLVSFYLPSTATRSKPMRIPIVGLRF